MLIECEKSIRGNRIFDTGNIGQSGLCAGGNDDIARTVVFAIHANGVGVDKVGLTLDFIDTQLFQVTDISLIPGEDGMGNEVVLNFTSRTGKLYAVDRSTELGEVWQELDDGVPGGDGSTEYRDIDLPDPLPKKLFYRVRKQD